MGNALSSAVISVYTHGNRLGEQYARLLEGDYAPLLIVVKQRVADFGLRAA